MLAINNLAQVLANNLKHSQGSAKMAKSLLMPVVSKMVADKKSRPRNASRGALDDVVNMSVLESSYMAISTRRTNNLNAIKLFPDIELAVQILVSSILSPKKMTDFELIYRLDKSFISDPAASAKVVNIIKEHLEMEYELTDQLPTYIRESLFVSGAHVTCFIPEAAVDEVVNADLLARYSTEGYASKVDRILDEATRSYGYVKSAFIPPKGTLSEELGAEEFVHHLASESFVKLVDNPKIVSAARLKQEVARAISRKSRGLAVAAEDISKLEYFDLFRQRQPSQNQNLVTVIKRPDQTKRRSIGPSLRIKLPTESVLPICVPGDPSKHTGYLVLLDEDFNPVTAASAGRSSYSGMTTNSSQLANSSAQTIGKAYNNLISQDASKITRKQLFEMYKVVVEDQLTQSIAAGVLGKSIALSSANDLYYLMFTRGLAGQRTNVLFLPKELVSYISFYHHDTGVGKSLLDDMGTLITMRAITLFSKVMGYMKSSIDSTRVNVELDPDDPDPEKTAEILRDLLFKARQNLFPDTLVNPTDAVSWVQSAGLQLNFANHPGLPDVRLEYENINVPHTVPSEDLEGELKDRMVLGIGLTPEIVDNGRNLEFATTAVNNNILLSKRVIIYQKRLEALLRMLAETITLTDMSLRDKLKEHFMEVGVDVFSDLTEEERQLAEKDKLGFIDYIISKLPSMLSIGLPKPENTNLLNQSTEFTAYKESLEVALTSVFSNEVFTQELCGELSTSVESLMGMYRHYFLRKWMSDNNFFSELFEVVTSDDDELNALSEAIANHLTNGARAGLTIFKRMSETREAISTEITRLTEGVPVGASGPEATEPEGGDPQASGEPDDFSLNF